MRLKIRTVAAAATAVGLVAAVSGALLVWMARGEGKWLVVVPVLMFAAVFVASRFFFNRFVAFRIKPIYQILLSKSVRTHELSQKADPVGHIEDELNRWAEKNAREIARLKENERYRKEFLGNVSHEIKTPIFTLQGYIVTLLDGAIEDKAVNRKYLERSEKNIDRLIHIVDDLEEISKLEAGAPVLEKECFDVVALVREIADSLEMDAARRRIGIRVGNPHGQPPVPVTADRRRIAQVITNLLSNSIKYGREGGETRIGFVDMFDRVLVEVKDDGIGIAEENIPRVFERFFRVDKSRSREQGGTGLGLAIVKHILEAHGERITLRSKLGEGKRFLFHFEQKIVTFVPAWRALRMLRKAPARGNSPSGRFACGITAKAR